jgi:hypothetical protein
MTRDRKQPTLVVPQAQVLAREFDANIIAIDFLPEFLDALKVRALQAGVADNRTAQSIMCGNNARPPKPCNTLGRMLFMREPLPATPPHPPGTT